MQVKCPNCSTTLKLNQAPASGQVKCPKCATIFKVGSASRTTPAASGKPAAAPKPGTQPKPGAAALSSPNRAGKPAPSQPKTIAGGFGGFDSLDLPASVTPAVRAFPVQAAKPYVAVPQNVPAAPSVGGNSSGPNSKGKSKSMLALIAGGISLLVFGVIGFLVVIGLMSGKKSARDEGDSKAPEGFTYVNIQGASAFFPVGNELETMSATFEYKAVMTDSTTVYFLAASERGDKELEDDQLKKRIEMSLKSGFILGGVCERKGMTGKKGRLDQGTYLPNLDVEVYQPEGRVVLIGVSMPAGEDGNTIVGQVAEPEIHQVFFDSFEVGDPPKTGFW